jgi:carbonic anhydrase
MHGLLYPERVARLKCVTDWLSYGERAKAVAEHIDGFDQMTDAEKAMALARENVLAQVDNLKTHPSVAAELSRGSLSLHAWMFEIHNGELLAWNSETGRFAPLETVSDNVPAVSAAQ